MLESTLDHKETGENLMRYFVILLCVCCFSVASVCHAQQKLTTATINQSLIKAGGKRTLEKYFNCEKYEGSAYPYIETGNEEWVMLAVKMLTYSDACYTEQMTGALGKAMQKAPATVLPLVDTSPVLSATNICIPFLSDEQPVAEQRRQYKISKDAIKSVKMVRVKTQRDACLRVIRKSEIDFEKEQ